VNFRTIRRALISVSDKTGLVDFARQLRRWNVAIISTGGTLRTLQEAGIEAEPVSGVTGFPEILDGRVKTLHPAIHAGLLAVTANPSHLKQIRELGIEPIDMVVVSLYPFEATIAKPGVTPEEAIEEIDIGGPAMLRAAAKNYAEKTVIINPAQYAGIIAEMSEHDGAVSESTRLRFAHEVFSVISRYDGLIAGYLSGFVNGGPTEVLPGTLSLTLGKSADLRYGENPHQAAALYGSFPLVFKKEHGKELSYNNIVDIQAAADCVAEFSEPAAVIIKHSNPCGAGTDASLAGAYDKAVATDRTSAFGGIVAVNRPLDEETARAIDSIFTEVIVAPGYNVGVMELLKRKKDRRLITWNRNAAGTGNSLRLKPVSGGLLVQTADDRLLDEASLKVVTKRRPSDDERAAMIFGWTVAKHVKSNAIVYARKDRTLGVGAGQMSRVDSCRIAVMKAKDAGLPLDGCAVASDAFFPFADGLMEAVKAGATAVIQPGGSVRDAEVIDAADSHNIAMVFTGIRHFSH
jgi:phosphoribosylaminoimidazolecarboxamide formyltransferase / IMP cyclohydrolase